MEFYNPSRHSQPQRSPTPTLRGGIHHSSDRPVAQALLHLAAPGGRSQQRPFFDLGRGLPDNDAVLGPGRHSACASAATLAAEVGDGPAVLARLDASRSSVHARLPDPLFSERNY